MNNLKSPVKTLRRAHRAHELTGTCLNKSESLSNIGITVLRRRCFCFCFQSIKCQHSRFVYRTSGKPLPFLDLLPLSTFTKRISTFQSSIRIDLINIVKFIPVFIPRTESQVSCLVPLLDRIDHHPSAYSY